MTSTSHLYLPTEAEMKQALRLRDAADIMAGFFVRQLDDPARRGCYFAALNPVGDLILHVPLGTVPSEKEWKYALFSREKPTRVFARVDEGHISSWQSRLIDEERQVFQYGGGVRFLMVSPWLGWGVGVSGFPEALDEAISLGAGYIVGAANDDFAAKVIEISGNPDWAMTREFAQHYRTVNSA